MARKIEIKKKMLKWLCERNESRIEWNPNDKQIGKIIMKWTKMNYIKNSKGIIAFLASSRPHRPKTPIDSRPTMSSHCRLLCCRNAASDGRLHRALSRWHSASSLCPLVWEKNCHGIGQKFCWNFKNKLIKINLNNATLEKYFLKFLANALCKASKKFLANATHNTITINFTLIKSLFFQKLFYEF